MKSRLETSLMKSVYVLRISIHSGIPAYEMVETHPDREPTLKLGHTRKTETDPARAERAKNRAQNNEVKTADKGEPESDEVENVMQGTGEDWRGCCTFGR